MAKRRLFGEVQPVCRDKAHFPLSFERLESRHLLAANLIISEIMAANDHSIRDFDGETSDWIELHNAGDESANLDGWFLTDDARNLTKWPFPDGLSIDPDEYQVVHASGRDRIMPNQEIHTNFRLSSRGEFLALVARDGEDSLSIVSSFEPRFPAMLDDVSYGLGSREITQSLVSDSSATRLHIPVNDALGTDWTRSDFNDEAWMDLAFPAGFAAEREAVPTPGFTVQMIDVDGGDVGRFESTRTVEAIFAGDFDASDFNVTRDVKQVVPQIDFGGFRGIKRETQPYLDGTTDTSLSDFALRATAEITIPPGEWTIAFGSNDGGYLRIPGVEFLDTFNENGTPDDLMPGDGEIWYDGLRGYAFTRATFTVGPDELSTSIDTMFFNRDGSDSFEILLRPGHVSERPRNAQAKDWTLLKDGALGWSVSTLATLPAPDFGSSIRGSVSPADLTNSSAYFRIPFELSADTVFDELALEIRINDGFIAYLNGTEIARYNMEDAASWNSGAASIRDDSATLSPLQFELIDEVQLLKTGQNVLAIHAATSHGEDHAFFVLPTLNGIVKDEIGYHFLRNSTPGVSNDLGAEAILDQVAYSLPSQMISDPFALTLSHTDESARIHYTTDGSIPTESSLIYVQPITIDATTQVRSRAFAKDRVASAVTSVTYVLIDDDARDFSSDMPILVLENFDQGAPERTYQNAFATLHEIGKDGRSRLLEIPSLTHEIGMRLRGASTSAVDKTNYRIEFRDEFGEDRNVRWLDLPAESDFSLWSPWIWDRTMLRSAFIFELGRQLDYYQPRTRFVEVFADTDGDGLSMSDYMGIYVVMETIKVDEDRLDIASLRRSDLSAPEITGGYIIENGRGDDSDSFKSAIGYPPGQRYVYDDPGLENLAPQQQAYIGQVVDEFESALFSEQFADPETGYAPHIDLNSFLDHHWMRLLSNDPDGLIVSTYWHVDREGPITMGPMWDFDRTMGNDSDERSANPQSFSNPSVNYLTYGWWGRLFSDPNFRQAWIDRYHKLRADGHFDMANFSDLIDQLSNLATVEARERTYDRWPVMTPNGGPFSKAGQTGYEGEISHLKGWLQRRLAWFDSRFTSQPEIQVSAADAGTSMVQLDSKADEIFFTVDGSDPRASGGTISPTATRYSLPFAVTEGTTIRARSFDIRRRLPTNAEIPWSGIVEMTIDDAMPSVVSVQRDNGSSRLDQLNSVSIQFSEDVSTSLETSDLQIQNITTGESISSEFVTVTYDEANQVARWDLSAEPLGLGNYEFRLMSNDIRDSSGNSLDGDGDGISGGNFTVNFVKTIAGDANQDFIFNSEDLVAVFTVGEYEDPLVNNSTWSDGDWNGDGEFTSSDLVAAFVAGAFLAE